VDNPYEVAAAVETAVFKAFKMQVSKDYKAKVRTLLFNLKDAKNPDLRRKVLIGELQPGQLVTMTSEELASDDKKNENQEIRCAAGSCLQDRCARWQHPGPLGGGCVSGPGCCVDQMAAAHRPLSRMQGRAAKAALVC
jgi:hypothetical protein